MRTNHLTVILAMVAFIGLGFFNEGFGQTPPASPEIDVSYVGPDDLAAIVIHPNRISKMPALAALMKTIASPSAHIAIDSVEVEQTMVLIHLPNKPNPGQVAVFDPSLVMHFTHPVDVKAKFLQILAVGNNVPELEETTIEGKSCFNVRISGGSKIPSGIFYSPDSKTLIYMGASNARKIIAAGEPKGPLVERLQKVDVDRCVAMAFALDKFSDLDEQIELAKRGVPAIVANYLDAIKTMHGGIATFNMKSDPLLRAAFDVKSEEAADDVSNLIDQGMVLARAGLAMAKTQLSPEQRKTFANDLMLADTLIAEAATKKEKSRVEFTMKRPAGIDAALPRLAATLQKSVTEAKAAARKTVQINNLKQIGLAMICYEDAKQHLPPAAITKDGKQLLSWRVAILPYLEESNLYNEFHLDEQWDSPHNLPLAKKMPMIFRSAERPDDGKTTIMVFAGKGTAFDGDAGIRLAQITDGTSNTIMAVAAGADKAVPWTKPEDVTYDPEKPLDGLGNISADGFPAVFCDGAVHYFKVNNAKLKLLIQRASGEIKSFDP